MLLQRDFSSEAFSYYKIFVVSLTFLYLSVHLIYLEYLCHDSRSDCAYYKARDYCLTSVSIIRACPVTCGACLRV